MGHIHFIFINFAHILLQVTVNALSALRCMPCPRVDGAFCKKSGVEDSTSATFPRAFGRGREYAYVRSSMFPQRLHLCSADYRSVGQLVRLSIKIFHFHFCIANRLIVIPLRSLHYFVLGRDKEEKRRGKISSLALASIRPSVSGLITLSGLEEGQIKEGRKRPLQRTSLWPFFATMSERASESAVCPDW